MFIPESRVLARLKKHVPELLTKSFCITRFTYNLLNRLLEDIQIVFTWIFQQIQVKGFIAGRKVLLDPCYVTDS